MSLEEISSNPTLLGVKQRHSASSVSSETAWWCIWGSLTAIAVVNGLAPYPLLSGNPGLLYSFLLAACAAFQISVGVNFLSRQEHALAKVLLVCFCVAQLIHWISAKGPPSINRGLDFDAYAIAGRLVSENHAADIYKIPLYRDGRMQFIVPLPPTSEWQQIAFRYGIPFSVPFIYPPLFAVLIEPLARLDPGVGYEAWSLISVVLLLTAALLILNLAGHRLTWPLGLLFLLGSFSFYPFYEELLLGQIGALILCLWTASLWFLNRGKTWLSAFCFALATMTKVSPVLAVPIMVIHRKWKWLGAYVVCLLGLLAFSTSMAGLPVQLQFVRKVLPSISCGSPVFHNSSIPCYVQQLFLGYVPDWMGAPITIPRLACPVSKMVSLAIYVAAMLQMYRRRDGNLIRHMALVALLTLSVSPISWWHHFTLAVLPFLYLWATMREGEKDGLLLATAIVISTNVVGLALLLPTNHAVQLVLAAIVPGLMLALLFGRLSPSQRESATEAA